MIRLAQKEDIGQVVGIYNAILDYQEKHINYTNWQKGLYPLKEHFEQALSEGTLYVGAKENGEIFGAVNLNHVQPDGYKEAPWQIPAEGKDVMVIHTLGIHPEFARQGLAEKMVTFCEKKAIEKGCKTMRLDTYECNHPAAMLYTRLGYSLRGKIEILFQEVIWETLLCMDKVL